MADDDDPPLTPRKKQTTPRKTSTPIRKTSAQHRTPNSAPVRKNTNTKKGGERDLFQDFLLGRPSVNKKARRKSLDGVKRELKLGAEEVAKLQSPGGVKDRVKQWQKASASPIPPAKAAGGKRNDAGDSDESDEEEERQARDSSKRPGRRKSKEAEDISGGKDAARTAARVAVVKGKERSKSAAAPKKRVISDDHWMKKAQTPPAGGKKSDGRQGRPIPKDFLQKTSANPPVERKIDDWMKRSAAEEPVEEATPRKRGVSRKRDEEEDILRRKASRRSLPDEDETPRRKKSSRRETPDDGIRVRPSPDPEDDGIRVLPSRDNSFKVGDDSVYIKSARQERRPKEEDPAEFRTPRKRSEKHLRPPEPESSHGMGSHEDVEDSSSWATPSRTASRRRPRKSASPTETLSDIPFSNSAFSVLDLPVGAEAGTMRRPLPTRNSSFVVPKVLKKVYTEGMKIVHDTVDPPRVKLNQPPSIESWLNETTDPFVDRPAAPANLSVPEPPSRMRSYKEDDRTERDLMDEAENERSKRKRRVQSYHEGDKPPEGDSPSFAKARETLPSMEKSSPVSPNGLRRSPATRGTPTPKSARKVPLKEALLDAFRGESTTSRPKSNPLADLYPTREVFNPPESKYHEADAPEYSTAPLAKSIPVARPIIPSQSVKAKDNPLPAIPRRQAPTTGEHRLSTIASVETFSTSSSASVTESELSQTTITQVSAYTAPTASSLSHNSNKSSLKRRLTKHSDLLSVLSLPDSGDPGRSKSIRSARSVRTNRSHIEKATVQDLMRELADDESKYMRELKTLVDGVIPVLLTSVVSKSESAIAAGLFDSDGLDASITKPIVDMGIALERLKSLHSRIPLTDPVAFAIWLQSAHKVYDDYLTAWRMGFHDVVVNLAPASRQSSADQSPERDEMKRNAKGDLVGDNGEIVDVAFLLKRPLVRVKFLRRIIEGLKRKDPARAEQYDRAFAMFTSLQERVRQRLKEEQARLEDRAANNLDTTRARDPQTLALAKDVKIDRTRQVHFKDDFSMDLRHTTGQRIECQTEIIMRDKPSDKNDPGDVLIVASNVAEVKQWLLLPPISKDYISGRQGDTPGEAVLSIRDKDRNWREAFILKTRDHDAVKDLLDCIHKDPSIPQIPEQAVSNLGKAESWAESVLLHSKSTPDLEVPIGERSRRDAEAAAATRRERRTASSLSTTPTVFSEDSVIGGVDPKDLNEAMRKAGTTPKFTATNHARGRYHSRQTSKFNIPVDFAERPSPAVEYDCVYDSKKARKNTKHEYYMSGGLGPDFQEQRGGPSSSTAKSPKGTTPLKESMRPDAGVLQKQRPTTPPSAPQNQKSSSPQATREDGAPPPPAHRVPTTPNTLKKVAPVLDSPTPKNRRTSSPLKHEYQPSVASDTSSSSEASDSDEDSYTDESSDDELEAPDLPGPPPPAMLPQRASPPVSLYNLPNGSVAPSNSASQAAARGAPSQKSMNPRKMVATISAWNDAGRWDDLHDGVCSIVVSPGCIRAYAMSSNHSSPRRGLGEGTPEMEPHAADEVRPLIEQELTPHVNLRQSVGVDLQISVRPTENSMIKVRKETKVIRYRTITERDNMELYSLVHYSRMNNPYFIQLEQDRMLQSYGTKTYENAISSNRRRSFFGRKNSYRATTRAPSAPSSEHSHSSSTVSRLRRLSGGLFNIPKSTLVTGTTPSSQYGSSATSTSGFSGATPPHTPSSPSLAGTSTSYSLSNSFFSNSNAIPLGNENIKIRLYYLVRNQWDDRGAARVTVTVPPVHMRSRSTIKMGILRRITVTQDIKSKSLIPGNLLTKNVDKNGKEKEKETITVIDDVLGADCFSKLGRSGVVCHIWDEVRGDNGEVGTVGKVGGLSGGLSKWCFQCGDTRTAEWIFGLCKALIVPGEGGYAA